MELNPYEAPKLMPGGSFNLRSVVRHIIWLAFAGSLGAGIGWFAGDVLATSVYHYKPTLAQSALCARITTIVGALCFAAVHVVLTILTAKQRRL
jgi:hypothetical protein